MISKCWVPHELLLVFTLLVFTPLAENSSGSRESRYVLDFARPPMTASTPEKVILAFETISLNKPPLHHTSSRRGCWQRRML